MSQNPNRLESILMDGYEFKLGEYINKGFNIFGKNAGMFIAYFLVNIAISMSLSAIPFLGQLASGIISGALVVGFYVVADKIERNEPTEFSNFFDGFKSWIPLLLGTLMSVFVFIVIMLPFLIYVALKFGLNFSDQDFFSSEDNNYSFGATDIIAIALFTLVVIYFSVAYIYMSFFIFFDKMEPWAALEASRKLVNKNFILHWVFFAVWALIMIISIIPLGLGLLATIPAFYCSLYAAWADITEYHNEPNEEDDILRHLID